MRRLKMHKPTRPSGLDIVVYVAKYSWYWLQEMYWRAYKIYLYTIMLIVGDR
jgi:hypothetical protein